MAYSEKVIRRFWGKVTKTEGCWLWVGRKSHDGYGVFDLSTRGVLAHRFSYELTFGPMPDGLETDHLCENRACVRPDHLEAVTHLVNIKRRYAKMTHCVHGHPFDGRNTYIRPDGFRDCRQCIRDRANSYRRRKSQARAA